MRVSARSRVLLLSFLTFYFLLLPFALSSAPSTTDSLRAAVFADDETGGDLYVQFNAFARFQRWDDLAIVARQLVGRQPAVLIRSTDDEALYWPARRRIAALLADQPLLAKAFAIHFDPEAEALLAEYKRTDNIDALRELFRRVPFVSLRGQAMRQLADGYLDRCDYVRAAAAFSRLRAVEPAADVQERAAWACKEASSLVSAGFSDEAGNLLGAIRRDFGNVTIETAGRRLAVGDFCSQLANEIGDRRPSPVPPVSPARLRSAKGWTFDFKMRTLETAFRRRHPEKVPVFEPASLGDTAYISSGNEVRAVKVADGLEQWTWHPARPDRYNIDSPYPWPEQLPLTSLQPAVTDDYVVFLRPIELAETVHSICCLDRATGRLRWQRVAWSDVDEAPETAPVVLGDRAFVVVSSLRHAFPEPVRMGRRAIVCFRLDTGEPLWRTALPTSRRRGEVGRTGSVSRPFLSGDSLLVLEDHGSALFCLDRATGSIRWARLLGAQPPGQSGRRGNGRFAAANGRVCVAHRGSSRVYCVNLDSGRSVWTHDAGSAIHWLASDGTRLYVAAEKALALNVADGAEIWRDKSGEPPVGPGTLVGKSLLVPTKAALHIHDAEKGRLTERLAWPDNRAMTHLIASPDGLVGMSGDQLRKFGKVEATAPTDTWQPEDRIGADEAAVLLFAGARPDKDTGGFPTVGRSLGDSPSDWIVFDREAQRLRCYEAKSLAQPRWDVDFAGDVRSVEFDQRYVYLWCADRVEIRKLTDGSQIFSRKTVARAAPVFADGRVIWSYERDQGGAKLLYVTGHDCRENRGFDVPLRDVGLRDLVVHLWADNLIYLLGDRPDGQRTYLVARLSGKRLELQGGGKSADSRIAKVDFKKAAWVVHQRKLFIFAPETWDLYCYSLTNGNRVWKSEMEDTTRPIQFLRRTGNHLIWCRGTKETAGERIVGVNELNSGRLLRRINAQEAFMRGGRLYAIWGPYLRVYNIGNERILKEVTYPRGAGKPVSIQAFGDRLAVALADRKGVVRQVMLSDLNLTDVANMRRGPQSERRYAEIPRSQRSIVPDGSLRDWEQVRGMSWQEIDTWSPVLDRSGRPVVGDHSAADVSARWRACATDESLFLAVLVRDDKIHPTRLSDCSWIGDSIELAVTGESFSRNLPTFTLSIGGLPQCWAAGSRPRLPPGSTSVAYNPIDRELVYEIEFPWSWLREIGVTPQRPRRGYAEIAFALVVNDDDGQGLEGSLVWSPGLADSWNPSLWKLLRFRVE